jgi:hypothetical protein
MENFEEGRSVAECSIPVDLQIKSLGLRNVKGRSGLPGTLDAISGRTGKPIDELKILEIAAGRANLAAWLIENEGVKPENYVIGDTIYPARLPELQKDIAEFVRSKLMRALRLDVFEKPDCIGQFDLIFMSFFIGMPECLSRFISNYFGMLNPGGMMVSTSAQYSAGRINGLTDKLARNPFLQIHQLSDDERSTFALVSQLHDLKEQGSIPHYSSPTDLFHENASDIPSLTFMLQKR